MEFYLTCLTLELMELFYVSYSVLIIFVLMDLTVRFSFNPLPGFWYSMGDLHTRIFKCLSTIDLAWFMDLVLTKTLGWFIDIFVSGFARLFFVDLRRNSGTCFLSEFATVDLIRFVFHLDFSRMAMEIRRSFSLVRLTCLFFFFLEPDL